MSSLKDIWACFSLLYLMLVGIGATIGQSNWNISLPDIDMEISDSYFVNSQKGWAVANFYGTVIPLDTVPKIFIIATNDGGATWDVVQNMIDSVHYLRKIAHIGNTKAYVAVGDHGLILRSNDEWNSMDTIFLGITEDITGVAFLDENTGFLCTKNGRIFRSQDGGLTWADLDRPPGNRFVDIDATMSGVVVCLDQFGSVLRSMDFGSTWEPHLIDSLSIFIAIRTQEDNSVLISGEKSNYWQSIDEGLTWKRNSINITEDFDIKDIFISKTGCGIAVCQGNNGLATSAFYSTLNGGDNWIQDTIIHYFPDVTPSFGNVHYFPIENVAYVTGGLISIYRGFLFFATKDMLCKPNSITNDGYLCKAVSIYPNPIYRGDLMTIANTSSSGNYLVFDQYGRIVKRGTTDLGLSIISTYNLPSGIYYLSLESCQVRSVYTSFVVQ